MVVSFIVLAIYFTDFVSGVFLDFKVVSNTNCWIVGPTTTGKYAIKHDTAYGWVTDLLDAEWIWDYNLNTALGYGVVTKHFYIAGVVNSGTFRIAADDTFTTYINGIDANCKSLVYTFGLTNGVFCDVKSYLRSGMNVLVVSVLNTGGYAGVMFKLEVTSNY
ncbi:hypothetical protein SteCoe_13735 [Stentor coeruleus]|uniref:PA14 domain-containing protein n=1 Tax=Stentor coeruleus TaxID=5963 RepID=A0A1R2C7V1_9CILI|nr:hypothetical protein SteCoe_13735 [Stentor coeruleus]